jgi:hypothetical protein
MASEVTVIRAQRLALVRTRFETAGPDAFFAELFRIVEIDDDGLLVAAIVFDPDDIDAAIVELDARYLAGEAADDAHTWSRVKGVYAALDRRGELPPTTPEWVNIDHRHGITFAPGDLSAYLRAAWELTPGNVYVEAIHRLNSLGAVVTHVVHGASRRGFDAEWREVFLLTFKGELIDCCEIFDEADIGAALARFDELSRPAPGLDNAANRVLNRYLAHFPSRDWDAMTEVLADDFFANDRRHVVNAGARIGRDAEIADLRVIADVGCGHFASTPIATRGERLVLARDSAIARGGPEPFHSEVIDVVEINGDERIAARVTFDVNDIDAAFEELDARYLAGEAAAHAHTWSVFARARAALARRELPPTTPDWANVDHRRGIAFTPGDTTAYFRALWDQERDFSTHIEAVHRLDNLGAVFTQVARGTSQEGFDAEWRIVEFMTAEGDLISGAEFFDEADIDAALARFDELSVSAPQLENAATRTWRQIVDAINRRDADGFHALSSADGELEDRRKGLRASHEGSERWRAAEAMCRTPESWHLEVEPIALRGHRLGLTRERWRDTDEADRPITVESLTLTEVTRDELAHHTLVFDPDDIDAAFAELDARYLAGEAAGYAHTWAVIAEAYASIRRHELPPAMSGCVNIDHRGAAAFAPGELVAWIRAGLEIDQTFGPHVEVVHRLTKRGAVVTYAAQGTSPEAFDAEWREISLSIVNGDMIVRCELFDETDLDAALAKFEQLTRPAPLENAASRTYDRFNAYLAARDWDAMAEMIADDVFHDDRRRVVSSGIQRGREAQLANLRASVDVGVKNTESFVIAIRGERLALTRSRVSGGDHRPEAFGLELLNIVELAADNRITAGVQFDVDDIDAAFAEFDARYAAGEAAAHSHTWTLVARVFASINRRELPELTPDWVNIDHRRGIAFEPGDMTEFIRAIWDDTPDVNVYIEAVHGLSDLGAVVTQAATGTSQQGFAAEWRAINISTVDGDLINRCELFDDADLDAALARFDELSQQAPRLENAASQVFQRFQAYFAARNWTAMAEILAEDMCNDDRRRVVGAGVLRGRDTDIAHMRAIADVGATTIASTYIATRGERLVLRRVVFSDEDQGHEEFQAELLGIVEIDADERILARVSFDADDLDAALAELDARYVVGEATAYAHTWSVIARGLAAFNRRELPGFTPDSVNIDHRRARGFAPGDLTAYIGATWDLAPDVSAYAEAVHRLSNLGAVWTHAVSGTSQDGFDAEWREICLATVEGDLISRIEVFDETDLDAALARFDELSRPAPRLENAACRAGDRYLEQFAAHDWNAMAEMLADDFSSNDCRRVVGGGVRLGRDAEIASMRAVSDVGLTNARQTCFAERGGRLSLSRIRFSGRNHGPEAVVIDGLVVVELNADNRIVASVVFDPDDIDAAFEELDARYLAAQAVAQACTWLLIVEIYAGLNRHELPATTPDWVNVDHRHVTTMAPGDLMANLRASWDLTPQASYYVEAVHRLTDHGTVFTHSVSGTSQEGFQAEWRIVDLLTFDGDLVNRSELFDEADLDAALARFDELNRPPP